MDINEGMRTGHLSSTVCRVIVIVRQQFADADHMSKTIILAKNEGELPKKLPFFYV